MGDERAWTAAIGGAVAELLAGEATLLERRLRPAGVGDTTLAASHLIPRLAVPATLILPIPAVAADSAATLDHTSGTGTLLRLVARLDVAADAAPVTVSLTRLRNEAGLEIGTVTIPAGVREALTRAEDLAATDARQGDWWAATCTAAGDGDTGAGLVLAVEMTVAVLVGDR